MMQLFKLLLVYLCSLGLSTGGLAPSDAFLGMPGGLRSNLDHIESTKNVGPRWAIGPNKFVELDDTEFSLTHKGYSPKYKSNPREIFHSDPSVPDRWDWRDHGIVGPVKNQAQCGSCWAFSAVSPLESRLTNATGKNVTLSEQEMVDCVRNILAPDNSSTCCDGCQGGEMYSVYQYLLEKRHGKDDTEKEYPYEAVDQDCNVVPSTVKLRLARYVQLPQNEVAIKQALYREGPISVGVDANTDWQLYTGGIYDPNNETCDPTTLDHGVVLVGYGAEKGLDYWIVRNSWGKDWGEKGYIRLARGNNACGVASSAIYPVLEPKLKSLFDSCHDDCGNACSSGPCGSCSNLCCGCGCNTCRCCSIPN